MPRSAPKRPKSFSYWSVRDEPSGIEGKLLASAQPSSEVESAFIAAHMPHVSISKVFAILIAAAMLFAPFAMQSGSAMAAMPSDHHAQTVNASHCEGQPAADQDGKAVDMSCCAAMCAAVAIAQVSTADPVAFARSIERPTLKQSLHSFLAKLPTPPPRLA